jgi:hypothetical protein
MVKFFMKYRRSGAAPWLQPIDYYQIMNKKGANPRIGTIFCNKPYENHPYEKILRFPPVANGGGLLQKGVRSAQ